MKIALFALAALAAAPALADDSKPYVFRNGRAVAVHSAGPRGSKAPAAARGATDVRPSAVATHVAGRALGGGGRRPDSGGRGVAARRAALGSETTPQPEYTKPGALIRSEGQLPQYAETHDATTHAVEGGGFISQDPNHSLALGGKGVSFGPADKMPGATPSTGRAGGNGVTSNGGSGASDGSGGSGSGSGGNSGANNNGQHNGQNGGSASGTGFDPAF